VGRIQVGFDITVGLAFYKAIRAKHHPKAKPRIFQRFNSKSLIRRNRIYLTWGYTVTNGAPLKKRVSEYNNYPTKISLVL
jgi:hypothetical protein